MPEFEKVRDMLERWVERLPEDQRKKAISSMRHKAPGSKRDEAQFHETFFELFLHEFLSGTGGEVEVDPKFNGKTPDFGVTEELPDGGHFTYVVEATDIDLARGTNLERSQNEETVIDWLDEIESPDFLLHIHMEGTLETTPPKAPLQRTFEELLQETDYEETLRIVEDSKRADFEDYPTTSFQHDGWKVVGHLLPVSQEHRGKTRGFVGGGPIGGDNIDDIGKTKDRLYDKARRYKDVENLIIAVRCDNSNTRLEEVLFGRQQLTIYYHNDPTDKRPLPEPHESQRLDGFWVNTTGPINRNVIGVVVFYDVHPGSVDKARAVFYPNPYVDGPIPTWAKLVTHAEYSNGKITIVEGEDPVTFLHDYESIGFPFGSPQMAQLDEGETEEC